jgi:Spy/CpxP family protein refolding chaperone
MLKRVLFAAFLPGVMLAQMMPGVCPGREGRRATLNLSEAQQTQISAICKDSSKKVFDLHEAWKRAEAELQAAFDESPVDQAKSNNAIEHLAAVRSDLFRATSQMELKIRTVLTDEQWQQLKIRQWRPGPGRPGGPDGMGRRRGGPPIKSTTSTTQQQQK